MVVSVLPLIIPPAPVYVCSSSSLISFTHRGHLHRVVVYFQCLDYEHVRRPFV